MRGALEQSMDGHTQRIVRADELDTEPLLLEQPLQAGLVEVHDVFWPVAQPESAHETSAHAAVVRRREEDKTTRVKRFANSTKRVSNVGEMLDRLERGHDIPLVLVTQVIEAAHGDVGARVLMGPRRRGAGQLHPANLPALLARRSKREARARAELEERARRTRVAPEQRELALEVGPIDRLVSEVVSVSDAGISRELKVVIRAVDRAKRVGRRDRIAPRETAGPAGDDPPAMRVHDAIGPAAAQWTGMGDQS